ICSAWISTGTSTSIRWLRWENKRGSGGQSTLPDELQPHLDIAIIVDRRRNAAELRRTERAIRNLKLRCVHHVEELRAELHVAARLRINGKILEHGKVEVHLARPVPRVPSRVSESEADRQRVCRGIEPALHRPL